MSVRVRLVGWIVCALTILVASPAGFASAPTGPFGFEVRISLSARAAAELRRLSEGIVVSAQYYGYPLPAKKQYGDQVGQIQLGTERITIPGKDASVVIHGDKVNQKRIPWLDGPASVNVNVFSARRSGPDNILACDFFDGNLADAQKHPIEIHCSLITENAPTSQKQ